jgi:glucose-1-phosphatase
MITTIICDVGGVLITPAEKVTLYILSQIYDVPMDVAFNLFNQLLPQLRIGAIGIEKLASVIQSQYPPRVAIKNFKVSYAEYYQKQAIINTEMLELLGRLNPKFKLVALSNMMDLHVKINRDRGLFKYFHEVYISSEIGIAKPDPAAFNYVLTKLDIKPETCIIIDDKKENIDVAVGLGFTGYLFDTAANFSAFIEKKQNL